MRQITPGTLCYVIPSSANAGKTVVAVRRVKNGDDLPEVGRGYFMYTGNDSCIWLIKGENLSVNSLAGRRDGLSYSLCDGRHLVPIEPDSTQVQEWSRSTPLEV